MSRRSAIRVGKEVRLELIRRVWKGDVRYARKLTTSRTVIVLDYEGAELAFIYSRAAKEIISFLDPDAPETAEWRRSRVPRAAPFRPRQPGRNGAGH